MEDFLNGITSLDINDKIDIGVIQGNLNNSTIKLFSGLGVQRILVDRKPRRLHTSWKLDMLTIDHRDYGGVTTSTKMFWIAWRGSKTLSLKNPHYLKEERDESIIHDDSIWCYKFKRKPKSLFVRPLECINMRSIKVPIYHMGGVASY